MKLKHPAGNKSDRVLPYVWNSSPGRCGDPRESTNKKLGSEEYYTKEVNLDMWWYVIPLTIVALGILMWLERK